MRSSSACERPPSLGEGSTGMRGEQAGHAPWASTSRRHHSEAHGLPGGTYVVTASSQSFFFSSAEYLLSHARVAGGY